MSGLQLALDKAMGWLRDNQLSEGQWEGEVSSWITNFSYGLSLCLAGERPESAVIQELCDFAESCVTPDGGIGHFPGGFSNSMCTYTAALFLGWARPRSQVVPGARAYCAKHPLALRPYLHAVRWVLEPQARPEILATRAPPEFLRRASRRLLPLLMYRLSSARKFYQRPFRPPPASLSPWKGRIVQAGFWPTLHDVAEMPGYLPKYFAFFAMAPWLALEHFAGNPAPELLRTSAWVRQYLAQGLYDDASCLHVSYLYFYQLIAEAVGDVQQRRRLDEAVREIKFRKGWMRHTSACINIFDTGQALLSLKAAGVASSSPMVRRAVQFMRAAQDPGGAWGWAYSASMGSGRRPTDMDDTTLGCLSLAAMGEPSDMQRVREGVKVLLEMQEPNGMINTWGDGPRPNISAVSINSRAIRSFLAVGMSKEHPAVRRACKWILEQQESDGSWVDHWVSRFTYGTAHALNALISSGYLPPEAPPIRRAVAWLLSQQNADGGWGEDYYGTRTGSTAEHTGMALHALCIATRGVEERALEAIGAGARWLADHQRPDGQWDALADTCFGDPSQGFADTLLPMVWGLMGLAEATRVLGESQRSTAAA